MLVRAGINVKKFKTGSTRSVSTSKASKQGAPVDEIMQAACGRVRPPSVNGTKNQSEASQNLANLC